MSHYTVLVVLEKPADAAENWLESSLDQALAPFDENLEVEPYRNYQDGDPGKFWAVDSLRKSGLLTSADPTWQEVADAFNSSRERPSSRLHVDEEGKGYEMSTYNPAAKWDWWAIGGRWAGYFPYKPGHASEVTRGASAEAGRCDAGPRGALDLNRLRDEKEDKARARYREWTELTAGLPDAQSWSAFTERTGKGEITIEEARKMYHDQPVIRAWRDRGFSWDDPVEEFSMTEDEYAEKARLTAVPGYATLTIEGTWMAPGTMGWFGSSDEEEPSLTQYRKEVNEYIDSLPDDVWLVAVDAHI